MFNDDIMTAMKKMGLHWTIVGLVAMSLTACMKSQEIDLPAVDYDKYRSLQEASEQFELEQLGVEKKSPLKPAIQSVNNRIATLYFNTAIAQLNEHDMDVLNQIYQSSQKTDYIYMVVSHSSPSLEKNVGVNVISMRRGLTVYEYLMNLGLAQERMMFVSEGADKPRYSEINSFGKKANQRVEIFIVER